MNRVDVLLAGEYYTMKEKTIVHFNAVLSNKQQGGEFMIRNIIDDMSINNCKITCKKSESNESSM